jgi:SpoVK/Ycf46/Vps4 family AAA+-type ATPase
MMSSAAHAAPTEASQLEKAVHCIFLRAQECAAQVASNSAVIFFDDLHDASSGLSSAFQQDTCNKEDAATTAAVAEGDEDLRPMMRSILADLFLPLDMIVRRAQENRKLTDPYLLIVAAANCRAEYFDPTIEHCFGAHLQLELPYESDRKKILTHYLSEMDHALAESELLSLVDWTDDWSGCDLKNLMREAAAVNIARQTSCQAKCQRRGDAKVQPCPRATRAVSIADFEDAIVARSG